MAPETTFITFSYPRRNRLKATGRKKILQWHRHHTRFPKGVIFWCYSRGKKICPFKKKPACFHAARGMHAGLRIYYCSWAYGEDTGGAHRRNFEAMMVFDLWTKALLVLGCAQEPVRVWCDKNSPNREHSCGAICRGVSLSVVR